MPGRVLIVDDDRSMCEMLEADLRLRQFECVATTSPHDALQILKSNSFHVVLTDLRMPGMSGTELCERIVANRPDVPVVVMTAFGSLESAVAAMRVGAYDFVTKPIELDLLALALERAVRHHVLQEKVKVLSQEVAGMKRFDEILGTSDPMQELFDQLARIADSEASVLITGESGTGKELVARAIHRRSRRRDRPFVAVNCAALPDALFESELFGHAKGAFTDARAARKGLFLEAESGTLFLDEIGDFPLATQAKLLRALEEQKLRPVGSDREQPFDVRILSATNRDLETAVEEGRFREDLYFRINVIQVEVPPLRARGGDILLLAQHFVQSFAARSGKQVAGLSDAVAAKLMNYSWPGNVRELRNVIERAVALTRYENLAVDDLPEKIRDYRSSQMVIAGSDPADLLPLEELERRYILHVLAALGGNKTTAARVLGLDRKTLYRKLQRWD
ncbi:MAG: sigma-54-dependent Fis family transcriptional regulator [Planctomycetaceae bacterium]|nr:sigma-54-dependent Fis family transcriptional regulator [Planctomycetaceae bacterium]